MASKLIGRVACPWCGFHASHVKESEKCVYTFCPECGVTTHFVREHQRALVLAKMRPDRLAEEPAPAPNPEPAPAPEPVRPAAKPARGRLFSGLGR
ncbi:MAG TPA: hypothetical protein VGE10_01700 [Zeimonas sp.]